MSETNLLTQFDTINMTPVNRICNEDRLECIKLQNLFEKSLKEILKWNRAFATQHASNPNPWFINSHSEKGSSQESPEYRFGRFEFAPLDGMRQCAYKAGQLCHEMEYLTIKYFNDKYQVNLTSEEKLINLLFQENVTTYSDEKCIKKADRYDRKFICIPDSPSIPTYETVIDYIIDQLGGLSFIQKRNKIDEEEFYNWVHWKKTTLKGKTVSIENGISICTWSYDGTRLSWDHKSDLATAFKGVRLAEGETESAMIPALDDRNDFGKEVILQGSDSLKSLKFFKNRKLSLTFSTEDQARKFHENTQNIIKRYEN